MSHRVLALALCCSLASATVAAAQVPRRAHTDWAAIDSALGRPGAAQPGGVMKYSFPRSDLQVTVGDRRVLPALALGSWVAFAADAGGRVAVMGDLVLLQEEIAPVMHALLQGGMRVTAVHNHLLRATPMVMYMHVAGAGNGAQLAGTIRAALALSATPLGAPAPAAPAPIALDTSAIASAVGIHGAVRGGVYQVSAPRREVIREHGMVVPPAMGVATAINFQPSDSGRALVTGDFVLRGNEVDAVMRALDAGGIAITALHSHLIGEEPRIYFMHFWGDGDAVALARTLRVALSHTATRRE